MTNICLILEIETPSTWTLKWYFTEMVQVGKVLVSHSEDAGIGEKLRPLRHALVKKLDAIQVAYALVLKDVEYDNRMILGDYLR